MKSHILYIISAFILLFSCKSRPQENQLNYMQNIEQIAIDASLKNAVHTIQTGDQLVILVTAKDNDVVRPFNQNFSSSEMIQAFPAGGNTPNAGNQTITGPTYIVDSEGNIDFPILNQINTTGKTIAELKDELRSRITKFVINPTVNIRLANFKVSVMGEVNRQGEYLIANGQSTLLNALALAGDLTMYGKRDDILVVRNVDGQITQHRINILDANFFNSPVYNLKQGDVIYVSANRSKELLAKQNPNNNLWIAIAGTALAAVGILVTVLKN